MSSTGGPSARFPPGVAPPDIGLALAILPRDMREELFNQHATQVDPEATERAFYKLVVPSGFIDIDGLQVDAIPSEQMQRYLAQSVLDLPPVVIADGRLIDGQHRITAARLQGVSRLRYIDLTGLIDTEAGGFVCEIEPARPPADKDRCG